MVISNKEIGDKAEKHFLTSLHNKGHTVLRPDWIGIDGTDVVIYEVKAKHRPWHPPPFFGHGLDMKQRDKYLLLEELCGIRVYLVIYALDSGDILGQWLDLLTAGKHKETKYGIDVYPITSYTVLGNFREE